jgi:hypothetical protein
MSILTLFPILPLPFIHITIAITNIYTTYRIPLCRMFISTGFFPDQTSLFAPLRLENTNFQTTLNRHTQLPFNHRQPLTKHREQQQRIAAAVILLPMESVNFSLEEG